MALRHIRIETMQTLTTHWCTGARAHLERPLLASLLPVFDGLRVDFERLTAAPEARARQLAELDYRTRSLDDAHDAALVRCWAYLDGVAGMYTDEAQGVAVVVLQQTLMPHGPAIKLRSHADQSKAARAAQAALTPAVEAQLAALNLPGIDLVAMMRRWIEAGAALAEVDAERAALLGLAEQAGALAADLRARWITAVQGLRTLADLDPGLDAVAQASLFTDLTAAERHASARLPD